MTPSETQRCTACRKYRPVEDFLYISKGNARHRECLHCRNDFTNEELDGFHEWLKQISGGGLCPVDPSGR